MTTAVEWFAERIQSDKIFNFETVLSKAKQMEKEQIVNAHDLGYTDCKSYCIRSGEEYYIETFKEKKMKDTIVESVIKQFKDRSDVGIAKYGVTLDREDLSTLEWINHAQQEAMDFCLYLERLKQEFNNQKQK